MTPVTFILFKWRPEFRASPRYTSDDVNRLASHLKGPVICYTDDAAGLAPWIESRPLWPDTRPLARYGHQLWKWTHARVFRVFSEPTLTGRLCLMDLDMTITGDMALFLDRPEPIVLTRSPARHQTYNPQVVLFNAGARPQLWDEFEGDASLPRIANAGEPPVSSGWLGTCLSPDEAVFPDDVPWRHGRNTMRVAA